MEDVFACLHYYRYSPANPTWVTMGGGGGDDGAATAAAAGQVSHTRGYSQG